VGELKEVPDSGIVDIGIRKWHWGLDNACAYFVFKDIPAALHEHCDCVAQKEVRTSES